MPWEICLPLSRKRKRKRRGGNLPWIFPDQAPHRQIGTERRPWPHEARRKAQRRSELGLETIETYRVSILERGGGWVGEPWSILLSSLGGHERPLRFAEGLGGKAGLIGSG